MIRWLCSRWVPILIWSVVCWLVFCGGFFLGRWRGRLDELERHRDESRRFSGEVLQDVSALRSRVNDHAAMLPAAIDAFLDCKLAYTRRQLPSSRPPEIPDELMFDAARLGATQEPKSVYKRASRKQEGSR